MIKIILWEHGHAYQPRRIIDSIINSSREVPGGLHIFLAGREVTGKNWFELMLKPDGAYDLMLEAMHDRSIDIDPITLHYLRKINPKAFERFMEKMKTGLTYIVPSLHSHSILPLLAEDSSFDAKVNVAWGIRFHQRLFSQKKNEKTILFWLSECAYSKTAAKIVLEASEEILDSDVNVVFLLDEQQGENIDSSHIYSITLDNKRGYVIFRCRWLSDAYAFSSDVEWIIDTLRSEIEQRDPKILGTMIDAETYGGAYNPQKPIFFSKLKMILSGGILTKHGRIHFDFMTANKILKADEGQEAKIFDYTAWSDYGRSQVFSLENMRVEGIIARKTGGLCRWTGCLRNSDGRMMKETYFTIFEWIHPKTKQRYIRVLNSLWKVAFNTIRREGAAIVRQIVFNILERIAGKDKLDEIIYSYDSVIFEEETPDKFVERHIPNASSIEKKAAQLALEAYKYANQDSTMSCPTFWQNFDTEVTWTALAFVAGGMILAAKACSEIGDMNMVCRIAEKYQELLIDFEENFQHLVDEYDLSLDFLYLNLKEIAKNQGFDVEREISEIKDNFEEKAGEIAERLYDIVLGRISNNPFLKTDTNKFLILSKVLENAGKTERAKLASKEAKSHEWHKCIGSVVSKYPIPVRVGVLHAKHFPNYERLLRLPTIDVEIQTEIIIGEAHAYDP